jgi:hypothetical protein
MHLETVWNLHLLRMVHGSRTLSSGDEGRFPWNRVRPLWRHYLADVASGRVELWAPEVPQEEAAVLAPWAAAALAAPPEAMFAGIQREVALARHDSPRPVPETTRRLARVLVSADAPLIEAFELGSAIYYTDPRRAPAIGVVVDGRLVTIAHSSRRTEEACELGIGTLPHARRRGYALAATMRWAETVAAEGLVPLYSALAENAASLALATAAGYRPFARAAYVVST